MSDTIAKGLATSMREVINLQTHIKRIDANDQSVMDALNKFSDKLDALTSRVQMMEDKMK